MGRKFLLPALEATYRFKLSLESTGVSLGRKIFCTVARQTFRVFDFGAPVGCFSLAVGHKWAPFGGNEQGQTISKTSPCFGCFAPNSLARSKSTF